MDIPPGSNVRYLDLVGSPLRSTLAVNPSGSCSKLLQPPSGTCPTSPSWANISVYLSVEWPNIPWWHGCSWHWHDSKGDNKVENKLEGLVDLGILLCPFWHYCTWLDFKQFGNPSLLGPYQFLKWCNLSISHFPPLSHEKSHFSVKFCTPEEAQKFERSAFGLSLILAWILDSGCPEFVDFWVITNIFEAGLLRSLFYYQFTPRRWRIKTDPSSIWFRRCMMRVRCY